MSDESDNSDDIGQRLIASEQIIVKAVIVPEGEDPTPYLLKAGITDPVEVPFTYGDDEMDVRSMGNGWTDAVPATLVFDDDENDAENGVFPQDPDAGQASSAGSADAAEPQMRTVQLPEAFGATPMAPVLRRR